MASQFKTYILLLLLHLLAIPVFTAPDITQDHKTPDKGGAAPAGGGGADIKGGSVSTGRADINGPGGGGADIKSQDAPAGGGGGGGGADKKSQDAPAGGGGGADNKAGAAPAGGGGGNDTKADATAGGGGADKGGAAPAGGSGGNDTKADAPAGSGGGADTTGGAAPAPGGDVADIKGGAGGNPQVVDGGSDYAKPEVESDYMGEWVIESTDVGVSAMQLQLMPNDQVVWYDSTSLGNSARKLEPEGNCPKNPDANNQPDCYAHAVSYDWKTKKSRTIVLSGEPWCSSGNLWPNGNMVATGGTFTGVKAVRMLPMDDLKADFTEKPNVLGDFRWYATNQILEDGSSLVVGGREAFSYEIVPPSLDFKPNKIDFPFLKETCTPGKGPAKFIENNLYPFVYLLPDGNVFIFANDRAVTIKPLTGEIIQNHGVCPGGSRNYPPSGSSAILPFKMSPDNKEPINVEVVICGGNKPDAFEVVDAKHVKEKVFVPALKDCYRIQPMKKDAKWEPEQDMPSPRIMGDLLHLPTGDLLLHNGAKKGTSGWENAIEANLIPVLYQPNKPKGSRWKELNPTTIARMYHSSSALLPDTSVLVTGSNPHQFYTLDVEFPTEWRVEKFSPPYLDPKLDNQRPAIDEKGTDKVLKYGKPFKIAASLPSKEPLALGEIKVTMLYPPFTTHGFSQNQRMIVPTITDVAGNVINALAPPSGKIAPPGYYILYVNRLGVPGPGLWVHID